MEQISKLFAVEAENLLASGLTDQAIELCQAGVGLYPDYPAGYIMLARALETKGDINAAASVLEDAISFFPANRLVSNVRKQFLQSLASRRKEDEIPASAGHEAAISIENSTQQEIPVPEIPAPVAIVINEPANAIPEETPVIEESKSQESELADISDILDITSPEPETENIAPEEAPVKEESIPEESDLADVFDILDITSPEPETENIATEEAPDIEESIPEESALADISDILDITSPEPENIATEEAPAIEESIPEESDLADISDILDITSPEPGTENIATEEVPATEESLLEKTPLADISDILDIEQPETEMESIILEEPAVTGQDIFETSPLLEITGLAGIEPLEPEAIAPEDSVIYQIEEELNQEPDLSDIYDFSGMLDIEQPVSENDAVTSVESLTEEIHGADAGTGFMSGSVEGVDPGLVNYAESNPFKALEVKLKKKIKPYDYYRRESDLISKDQFLEFNPIIEVGSLSEIDELWKVVDSEYEISSSVHLSDPEDLDYDALPELNNIDQPEIDQPDISGLALEAEEPLSDDIDQLDTIVSETRGTAQAQEITTLEDTPAQGGEEEFLEEYIAEETAPEQKAAPKLIFRSAHNPGAEYFTANDIKAANLNLIPGLHYSPLKVRAKRFVNINHIKPLPEPPAFAAFARKEQDKPEPPRQKEEPFNYNPPRNLSLKDLADQIKNFGSQESEDIEESQAAPESEEPRSLVTETMARIYMMQGAFMEAASAYRALADSNPDKRDYFLEKAEEAEEKAKL